MPGKSSGTSRAGLTVIGWREWVALPALGITHIKAKTDTGARTSALHAFYVEPFQQGGIAWIRFGIHPLQKRSDRVIECSAPVADRRIVIDSGGHPEQRYVIETPVRVGAIEFPIELTLTNRDTMRFRMLLGRVALQERFLIDPSASYLTGNARQSRAARQGEIR